MRKFFLAMLSCVLAFSQTPKAKPAFDVASIKPLTAAAAAERRYHSVIDDARVDIGNVTLADLIRLAYRVTWDQVVRPDWTAQQRFDVQATLPPGASKDMVPEMLQTLLAERFKLAVHHDPRVLPVYNLTVAKTDRSFGNRPLGPPVPQIVQAACIRSVTKPRWTI